MLRPVAPSNQLLQRHSFFSFCSWASSFMHQLNSCRKTRPVAMVDKRCIIKALRKHTRISGLEQEDCNAKRGSGYLCCLILAGLGFCKSSLGCFPVSRGSK